MNMAYAKLFLANFYPVIGNLYSHRCTKFWEFALEFRGGLTFFTHPVFILCVYFKLLVTAFCWSSYFLKC